MRELDQRPPRASIVNLSTGDDMDFLVNPETWTVKKTVNYARTKAPGNSHERLQFINTGNRQIAIELYMSQQLQDLIEGRAGSRPYVATERRAFLESLCNPAANMDFGYQGPPQALFLWPTMERFTGRVVSYDEMHREFSVRTLATTILVVRLTIEEDLEFRMLMDDIYRARTTIQRGGLDPTRSE
jgi:hypothetical protein